MVVFRLLLSIVFSLLALNFKAFSGCSECESPEANLSMPQSAQMQVLVITDKECPFCSLEFAKKIITDRLSEVSFKVIDYREPQAKELIDRYDIDSLPVFILPIKIKEQEGFNKIANIFQDKKDTIFLKKELSGVFLLLNRKKLSRNIDFFLNVYQSRAGEVFDGLLDFSKRNGISLNIHFIIPQSDIEYPEEEARIALAVKRIYPKKFYAYLKNRLENIGSIYWTDALRKLDISYKRIEKLARSKNSQKLLNDNVKLAEELGIKNGNVILVQNNRLFKVFQINSEDLEKIFKIGG